MSNKTPKVNLGVGVFLVNTCFQFTLGAGRRVGPARPSWLAHARSRAGWAGEKILGHGEVGMRHFRSAHEAAKAAARGELAPGQVVEAGGLLHRVIRLRGGLVIRQMGYSDAHLAGKASARRGHWTRRRGRPAWVPED